MPYAYYPPKKHAWLTFPERVWLAKEHTILCLGQCFRVEGPGVQAEKGDREGQWLHVSSWQQTIRGPAHVVDSQVTRL